MTQTVTAARIDFVVQTNQTWEDALQFGTVGDTSWSFTGQNFRLDLKSNKYTQPSSSMLSVTSGAGQIVVIDPVQRILQFNVPESIFSAAAIIPGEYDYDLIMFDGSVPPVRIPLAYGKFHMKLGVTGG